MFYVGMLLQTIYVFLPKLITNCCISVCRIDQEMLVLARLSRIRRQKDGAQVEQQILGVVHHQMQQLLTVTLTLVTFQLTKVTRRSLLKLQ
jgi:hypothetical protein